jgi:hypothetical protein
MGLFADREEVTVAMGMRGDPLASGAYRDRTGDLLLAKQALSQLS